MNNLDNFSKRILTIAVSVSLIFLSGSILFWSAGPAYANSESNYQIPSNVNSVLENNGTIGKYQMEMQLVNAGGTWYKEILVWDTETGKSKFYMDMKTSDELPEKPL